MDWDVVTATWVREGLIGEEQAPALRDWLVEHGPRPSGALGDVALTVVAMAGAWLLTGAASLMVAYLEGTGAQAGAVALATAVVWAVAAVGVWPSVSPAVGAGLGSAAIVIGPAAVMALFEGPPSQLDVGPLMLALAPAVVGTGLALWLTRQSLGLAASIAAAMVFVPWVYDQPGSGWAEVVLVGAVLYAALGNVLAYLARLEEHEARGAIAAVLQSQVAFATVIAIHASFARVPLFTSTSDAWLWEAGTALTGTGLGLLALGALGQSRMTLVSGLAALVVAEVTFLTAFGDVVAAIVILGLEGLGLLVAVIAVVAARVGRARRQASGGR